MIIQCRTSTPFTVVAETDKGNDAGEERPYLCQMAQIGALFRDYVSVDTREASSALSLLIFDLKPSIFDQLLYPFEGSTNSQHYKSCQQ